MKTFLTSIFIIIITFVRAQSPEQILETAYKKRSYKILHLFFENWKNEIQPVSEKELCGMNDTLRQSYILFNKFYRPTTIDSLGISLKDKDIYKTIEYLIIPNSIKINFNAKVYYTDQEEQDYVLNYINNIKSDSTKQKLLNSKFKGRFGAIHIELYGPYEYSNLRKNEKLVDSVFDFRPKIDFQNKQPLYLSKKYNDALNVFLGNNYIPLGAGGIMNPARSTGHSEKRKVFLEKYVRIWYGHWGGYWQLSSYPKVYSITYDNEMNYARIDFKFIYTHGEAYYEKQNNNWTLIFLRKTWVE